jgi:hypothetical protein
MLNTSVQDGCNALLWCGCSVLLYCAAWQMSWRLFPHDTVTQLVGHAILICWAAITAVAVLLGIVGALCACTLLLGASGVGVACLYALKYADDGTSSPSTRAVGVVSESAVQEVPLSQLTGLGAYRIYSARSSAWARLAQWVPVATWSILLAFWGVHVVADGLLTFPRDYDSLMYHIPLVDQWLHGRSLYAPDSRHWNHPGGNEVIALWMVAPFSGDFLVSLTNVPAVVLLALGSYELARNVGLSRAMCHLATLMVVSIYPVMYQLVSCGNDVAVAGLFMTCVAYGLRYVRGARSVDILFAAVSVGLLAGVKFYALGYAAVAVALIVAALISTRGWRTGVSAAGVMTVGILLWGGYWYARNAALTGSPLYPVGAGVDADFEAGMNTDIVRSSLLGNGHPDVLPLIVRAVWTLTGPGHFAGFIGSPIVFTWLIASGVRLRASKGRESDGTLKTALAFLILASGVVLAVTPYAVEDIPNTLNHLRLGYTPIRYGMIFFTATVFGLAVVIEDLAVGLSRWCAGWRWGSLVACIPVLLFASIGVFQFAFPATIVRLKDWDTYLFCAGDVVMSCGIVCAVLVIWPQCRRVIVLSAMVLATIGAPVWIGWLSQRWHKEFDCFYERLFDTSIVAEFAKKHSDNTCVCALTPIPYPFFGSRRQFRVCQPLENENRSYGHFLQYLRSREATVLVTYPPDDVTSSPTGNPFRRIIPWVVHDPAIFAPLKADGPLLVFQIRCSAADHAGEKQVFVPRMRGAGSDSRSKVLVQESLDDRDTGR